MFRDRMATTFGRSPGSLCAMLISELLWNYMCSPALPNSNTHTQIVLHVHVLHKQNASNSIPTSPQRQRVDRRARKNEGWRWSRGNKHHALHAVSSTISTCARERERMFYTHRYTGSALMSFQSYTNNPNSRKIPNLQDWFQVRVSLLWEGHSCTDLTLSSGRTAYLM